jgi:putative SbcD/Mre11-related phosphoesterase
MPNDDLQPIPGEPVLFSASQHLMVLADLHIGIEIELREQGLHPPDQTPVLRQRLEELYNQWKPTDVLLLGDIKHTIPAFSKKERWDVIEVLSIFDDYASIHLVPGNHDGNLHRFIPSNTHVYPSNGVALFQKGFIHGHRWAQDNVMECPQIIMGHSHPTVKLTDRLGYTFYEPCWLKARCYSEKLKQRYPSANDPVITIMPAFNPLCGGIAVNSEGLTGPYSKLIDIPRAEVYLLDGTYLGRVRDLP